MIIEVLDVLDKHEKLPADRPICPLMSRYSPVQGHPLAGEPSQVETITVPCLGARCGMYNHCSGLVRTPVS